MVQRPVLSAPEAAVIVNERHLTLWLTPHGRLILGFSEDAPELEASRAGRIERAFARGAGHGLFQLGAGEVGSFLPPIFVYWREFAARFVTALCTRPAAEGVEVQPPSPPADSDLEALAAAAPMMHGAEYLTAAVLRALWAEIGEAFAIELRESGATLQEFLKGLNPAWNLVGRVHFNLAENRRDEEAPFAFLATYTSRLSAHGKAQHLPLGQALREYAGTANKERLLSLLLPVQRAAERCVWLRQMVDAGEIFHPLRWSAREAFRFLSDAYELEQAGVVIRMPATWRAGRPPRPQVTGTLGTKTPSGLGKDALLDFRVEVMLDGKPITPAEVKALLAGSGGLALIRGQWVEVDRERLERTMRQLQEAERLAGEGGLTFAEAMRMLSGATIAGDGDAERADPEWSRVTAGPWLAEALNGLRSPEGLAKVAFGRELNGTLRAYQQIGVRWLHLLSRLGLGACLADDMGLGKTIQVLSLLLVQRAEARKLPSLLVAPASLLANWTAEIERFAPSLKTLVAHPSAMLADDLKALSPENVAATDLVITSYGSLLRIPWLQTSSWQLVILDEAQAIKNPEAKQSRAAKDLQARARIALTGTPIENHLSDLWSIFDFINPGLLGSAKEFSSYSKRLASSSTNPYGPLRDLVRPYILRRLKTDKSVIADLPEKTEVKAFCQLSRKQAALYQDAVKELREQLDAIEGIKRRGVVLAFLMRLKQICNHPSQWLGDGAWNEADSGKWARLREIAEVIAAKQEKALVFTQFREVTAPLAAFLGEVFGRQGLVLHGQTEVGKRRELVQRFQQDEAVPFFVLSLKAGGAGLNLTAASHVVHFDRWWNPAVENQATDRAFRIGQRKNVLVHKFVCKGTVEEKIDELIESKKQALQGSARRRRRAESDRAGQRGAASPGQARPGRRDEGVSMWYEWRPYIPVAQRRRRAELEMQKLKKKGHPVSPVVIVGRAIAQTFWGKAWCDNLERYSDFSSRLPRGRTYVRNGSVVDLQISPGEVAAMVSGSELYKVAVKVSAVPRARWSSICRDCAGAIDTLVELLQGRFSEAVMARICQEKVGLFPAPAEIEFSCSCPDWASMCKHVAAVLYGVGARLDERPELLFKLRQVHEKDLIARAGRGIPLSKTGPSADKVLATDSLSELFGLEMESSAARPGDGETRAKRGERERRALNISTVQYHATVATLAEKRRLQVSGSTKTRSARREKKLRARAKGG